MAADTDERATIARVADEVVPALIERLASSELGELEVRQDGWRVRLRRAMNGDGATAPVAAQAPHKPAAVAHATDQPSRREPVRGQVKSPAVGFFTLRDGVAAGSKVRSNDNLGFVDVLGVRQEVVSPGDGVLKSLEVESGQAVEFGQVIGRVEANV
ncbi:MAG: biotin/lipoyl-containing protein [Candidatus Limnocylindrales bacterium]